MKQLHIGQTKTMNAIDRLVDAGLLEVITEEGKHNTYHFPETEFDKQFEMFTPEFLDLDMPIDVKEYYMDIQQYLYGKETGKGRCSLSNLELSRRTGWSNYLIKKCNTFLIEHGYLDEEVSPSKKDEAGLPVITRVFNLTGLNQAALWVKAVTEQVQANTNDIEDLKQSNEELKQSNEELRREIELLKKEQARLRNATPTPVQYSL